MPCAYSHHTVAKKIYSALSSADSEALSSELDLYFIGAQGPDPYIFLTLSPFKKTRERGIELSELLHTRDVNETFRVMLQYAAMRGDDGLWAYCMGYITHCLLDRIAHPYILARTEPGGDLYERKIYHTPYETALDVAYMEKTGETLAKAVSLVPRAYQSIPRVTAMMREVFSEKFSSERDRRDKLEAKMREDGTFPEPLTKAFADYKKEKKRLLAHEDALVRLGFESALRRMRLALTLLYDPKGRGRRLFSSIAGGQAAGFFFTPGCGDSIPDIFNLEKTVPEQDTYFELIDKAVSDGVSCLTLAMNARRGGDYSMRLGCAFRDFISSLGNMPLC